VRPAPQRIEGIAGPVGISADRPQRKTKISSGARRHAWPVRGTNRIRRGASNRWLQAKTSVFE
jgi:hypothetical protein